MRREIIATEAAPAAIGTYSQAVRVGQTVYLSGQIPLEPDSMAIVEGGIEAEIGQVFANLEAVCRAAGGGLADIVKLNVYLVDLGHFSLVNEIMGTCFEPPFPARAAVQVAALPRGARVEMDAIMVVADD